MDEDAYTLTVDRPCLVLLKPHFDYGMPSLLGMSPLEGDDDGAQLAMGVEVVPPLRAPGATEWKPQSETDRGWDLCLADPAHGTGTVKITLTQDSKPPLSATIPLPEGLQAGSTVLHTLKPNK